MDWVQPRPALQARSGCTALSRTRSRPDAHSRLDQRQTSGSSRRFLRYEASQWEVDAWKEEACEQVASGASKVSAWLRTVQVRNCGWHLCDS